MGPALTLAVGLAFPASLLQGLGPCSLRASGSSLDGRPWRGEKQPPPKCAMPELEAATQMLSLAKALASPRCITLSNILGRHPCASQLVLEENKLSTSAGDTRGAALIPGSGRSPGGGPGNPLEYSRLENSVDRGAWRATVHGVKNEVDTAEAS